MAKKLGESEQVDFDAPKTMPSKHPWEEWLDGSQWLLTQAEDFPDATVGSMARLAAAVAKRRGLTVRTTKLSPDTLVICASR